MKSLLTKTGVTLTGTVLALPLAGLANGTAAAGGTDDDGRTRTRGLPAGALPARRGR